MNNLTLRDIKELKEEFKRNLANLISDFNFKTGTTIDEIHVSYNDYESDTGYLFSQIKNVSVKIDYERHIK